LTAIVVLAAVAAVASATPNGYAGAGVASGVQIVLAQPDAGPTGPAQRSGGTIYRPAQALGFVVGSIKHATRAMQGTVVYAQRSAGGAWRTLGSARCTYEPGFHSCGFGVRTRYVPPRGYTLYRACLSRSGRSCSAPVKAFVGGLHPLTSLTPVAHSDDYSVGPLVTGGHRWPKAVRFYAHGPTDSFVEYDLRGTCPVLLGPLAADDSFRWEDDFGNSMHVDFKLLLDGVQADEGGIAQELQGDLGERVKTDWGVHLFRITASATVKSGGGPPDGDLGGYYGLMPAWSALCAW
jgi:hypothetical protein